MTHHLRPFSPPDLRPLQELVQRTIDVSYGGVYPPEAIRFFEEYDSLENVLKDAEEGHTVVLEIDGEIRGTGALVEAEIKRVFVDPALQGQGLGKTIMHWIEESARAKGAETVHLDASVVAEPFYDRLGYAVARECSIPVENGQRLAMPRCSRHCEADDPGAAGAWTGEAVQEIRPLL
jgi:GNAT superfamily N-acetyltransferase